MNATFLKKIFGSKTFIQDYKVFLRKNSQLFLDKFAEIIEDDNSKKVKYLSQVVSDYLISRSTKVSFHVNSESLNHKTSTLDSWDSQENLKFGTRPLNSFWVRGIDLGFSENP